MRDMTHPEGGLFAAEDADRCVAHPCMQRCMHAMLAFGFPPPLLQLKQHVCCSGAVTACHRACCFAPWCCPMPCCAGRSFLMRSLDPASGKKKEGWFYVWTHDEIQEVLGEYKACLNACIT